MKYELLKRTAIALFVGGIVSTYAMAEDKAVDDALAALGKAINANATKQTEATEAVKSELTKKIEEQDKKINDNTTAIFGDDDDPENPGLLNTVDKHTDAIYGTKEDPDSGLINVVNKQTEAIAKLEARDTYNHLDKVEELIKNKAEKTELKKVNADVENNTRSIQKNKVSIDAKAGKIYVDKELAKKANSADVTAQLKQKVDQSTLDAYNNSLVAAIGKKADQTDVDANKAEIAKKANQTDVDANKVEIAKKANSSDVYTKDEANNRFVQIENNVGNNVTSISQNRANVTTNASNIARHNVRLNTLDSRVDKLDNRVNKLDKDLKRGLAAQAALTGLFQPYTVGKANFTAAVGGYKSQTAVAVGTGYRYNQNIATKAGVAFTQGGGVTYNAGVNFEW